MSYIHNYLGKLAWTYKGLVNMVEEGRQIRFGRIEFQKLVVAVIRISRYFSVFNNASSKLLVVGVVLPICSRRWIRTDEWMY